METEDGRQLKVGAPAPAAGRAARLAVDTCQIPTSATCLLAGFLDTPSCLLPSPTAQQVVEEDGSSRKLPAEAGRRWADGPAPLVPKNPSLASVVLLLPLLAPYHAAQLPDKLPGERAGRDSRGRGWQGQAGWFAAAALGAPRCVAAAPIPPAREGRRQPPGALASLGPPAASCHPMGVPAHPAAQLWQRAAQQTATRWRHGGGRARQRPRRRRPAASAPKNAPACASRPGRCPWAAWSRSAALQGGAWGVWGSAGARWGRKGARTWGVHTGRAPPVRLPRRPCLAASRLSAGLPAAPAASTQQGLARGTAPGPD